MKPVAAADAAAAIRRWFDVAVLAVDPANAIKTHLKRAGQSVLIGEQSIPVAGRLFVVAIGKAALGMARGASSVLGELIDQGFIITKDGHLDSPLPDRFEAREASHPIPNARGIAATEQLLASIREYGDSDVILALISGGGSALLEAPIGGITLQDVSTTTELLLRAGAPIQDLNAVRIPLSSVKGGGLRHAAPGARFVTLVLSDVLGNDTQVIASGPTVPTDFTRTGALTLLERYGLLGRAPESVRNALARDQEQIDTSMFESDVIQIVGDNDSALEAFAAAAERDGLGVDIPWRAKQGEARELAFEWVDLLASADSPVDLLLGGGEATVTVRGEGEGGRNTEFTLAAGLELERRDLHDWIVASLATDGQDALTGVAGAIVTANTIQSARAAGVDPERALARNDSLAVFRSAGGGVEPGPTGTNVNDIYVALRIAASD